jgi:hypothetical protein
MSNYFNMVYVGQVGVIPNVVSLATSDSLATITTAGWIDNKPTVEKLSQGNFVLVLYDYTPPSSFGTFQWFTVSITSGVTTLEEYTSPGNVSVIGTPGVNSIASFATTNGDITDATSTIITHLGPISSGAFTGTQGIFIAYTPSNSKGSFQIRGSDNVGNTDTILTNASMGQGTTLTIADPGQSTGVVPVQTGTIPSGNMIKAGANAGTIINAGYIFTAKTTASWGGGGTTHTFTAADVLTTSKVVGVIAASANDVAIAKIVPGAGSFDVTFTADPGAGTTITYMATSVAV